MKSFTTITSHCLPIRTENIDTDQIIPAQFLKTTVREGIGKFLFYNWRFDENGKEKQSVFSDPRFTGAHIMIAGNNFGCGSSREHAPWALLDFGFSVIISSSFGDIFYTNSLKNGLLPVIVTHKELDQLLVLIENEPETHLVVDVEKKTIAIPHRDISFPFPISEFHQQSLLHGVDEMGFILSKEKELKAYEKTHSSIAR